MTSGEQPEDLSALNSPGADPMPLPDLSAVPLTRLRTIEPAVLADCLERLQCEVADSESATAGFNSAI